MRSLALAWTVSASVVMLVDGAFQCDNKRKSIPDGFVNDGFCDCEIDGADETTTNACALAKRGAALPRFACADTLGYEPFDIPAHLFGDGVCDCCDGSDEAQRKDVTCPNECERRAAEARAAAAELAEKRRVGVAKFKEYVAEAAREFDGQAAALQAKEAELKAMDAEVEQLEKALHAKREEQEAQRKKMAEDAERNAAEAIDLGALGDIDTKVDLLVRFAISVNDTGIETLLQLVTDQLPAEVTDALDDVEVLSLAMEANEKMYGTAENAVEVDPNGVVSPEAAAALDAALTAVRGALPLDVPAARAALDDAAVDAMLLQLGKDLKQTGLLASLVWQALGRAAPDPLPLFPENVNADQWKSPEVEEAQKHFRDRSTARRHLRDEVKDMEGVGNHDFGAQRQYFPLYGKCFKRQVQGFDYEVCPFKEAKQDSTKLGKFGKWEQPDVMLFENGAKCWNGPKRSLAVTFVCGGADEILAVEEPETCTYQATFASPAACGDM